MKKYSSSRWKVWGVKSKHAQGAVEAHGRDSNLKGKQENRLFSLETMKVAPSLTLCENRQVDIKCGFNVSPDNGREKHKDRWHSNFKFGNLAAVSLLDLYFEEVKCFRAHNYGGDNTVKVSSLKCKRLSQRGQNVKERGWALAEVDLGWITPLSLTTHVFGQITYTPKTPVSS